MFLSVVLIQILWNHLCFHHFYPFIPQYLEVVIQTEANELRQQSREMGFDLNRFDGSVDEELMCTICSGVLEDPVHVSHNFA